MATDMSITGGQASRLAALLIDSFEQALGLLTACLVIDRDFQLFEEFSNYSTLRTGLSSGVLLSASCARTDRELFSRIHGLFLLAREWGRCLNGQCALHSWGFRIDRFIQMDFTDAIIIDVDGIANRILRDLESSVEISSQGRREKKLYRKNQRMCLKVIE